jgi:hypothetical protein
MKCIICEEDGADFVHIGNIANMEKLIKAIRNTENIVKNNENQKMDKTIFKMVGNLNNKKLPKSLSKIRGR